MTKLIAKGAEACLYLEDWYGYPVIRKQRFPKPYRLPQMDTAIRNDRTIREARMLSAARHAGVATPIIYSIDTENAIIIMEYIESHRMKELLPTLSPRARHNVFKKIGNAVATLHQNHIAHGDLTTSNLLLHLNDIIYFIDFGLASTTHNIEDFGTDVHLLRRALLSTHYSHWETCYDAFKKGYEAKYGKNSKEVFKKVRAIESRGRYISERYG